MEGQIACHITYSGPKKGDLPKRQPIKQLPTSRETQQTTNTESDMSSRQHTRIGLHNLKHLLSLLPIYLSISSGQLLQQPDYQRCMEQLRKLIEAAKQNGQNVSKSELSSTAWKHSPTSQQLSRFLSAWNCQESTITMVQEIMQTIVIGETQRMQSQIQVFN